MFFNAVLKGFHGRMAVGAGLVFLAVPALGEDLLGIYQAAQANDPKFRGAQQQTLATGQQAKQLRAGYLPQVSVELQRIETDQTVISSDNQIFQQGNANYGTDDLSLSLSQAILRWDRIEGWKQSRLQEDQADARQVQATQDLQMRVAETYFGALAARDAVILSRAELASATRQYEDADARYRRGLARRTDQLDAQARMSQVEAGLMAKQNAYEDALEALRELTGRTPETLNPVARELQLAAPDPVSVDSWIRAAADGNIEIQVQRMAVDIADREVERQRAGHYPTLDLRFRHNERTTDGSLFGGGSETESDEITLAFNVPLYSGGSVWAKRKEAAARHEQSKEELERTRREVERQTRAAYQGLLSAIRRARALEQAVKAQELAVETKRRGFQAGLYTSMTVLDAEEDLYADRYEYALARYDYLVNWVKLRRATGQLTGNDLALLNAQLVSPEAEAPVDVPTEAPVNGAVDAAPVTPAPTEPAAAAPR
jgi:outer membrane protein